MILFGDSYSILRSKIHYWKSMTRSCFATRNPLLAQARELQLIAMRGLGNLGATTRTDFSELYWQLCHPSILASYSMTIDFHDAVQKLLLAGHPLNSMCLLRPHMDALLLFIYFTEPLNDWLNIGQRIEEYNCWVIIKMKENMERSKAFGPISVFPSKEDSESFQKDVCENYRIVMESLSDNESLLHELEKAHSFPIRKRELAERNGIADLYNYVYAESSASIHLADISDRFETVELEDGVYNLHVPQMVNSMWPSFLSNMILAKSIRFYARFFAIEQLINSQFDTMLGKV